MAKRKKNSRKSKKSKKEAQNRIKRDISGILLVLLSVFIIISLLSYNPDDPSWASVSSVHKKVHNYGGKVGASLSEALIQFLGLSSLVLPIALVFLGFQSFFPKKKGGFLFRAGESLLICLILSPILSIIFNQTSWKGSEVSAGGVIGDLSSSLLIKYFSQLGSLLVLFSLLFIVILFSTHIRIRSIFDSLVNFFKFLFKELRIKVIDYKKQKNKERMRKRVVEKYSEPKTEKKKPSKKPVAVSAPAHPKENKTSPEGFLFPELKNKGDYQFPPINLLDPGKEADKINKNELYEKKQIIEDKLSQFKVNGEVREYQPGPIITTYEFYPSPGVKVSQVSSRTEDLSLALGAESLRIQRIPGKSSLGIEIPNNKREIIRLRDVIQTKKFMESPSKLTIGLGKTIHGEPYISDLSVMPHLLIAGATGTGKSVALNSIIASILYKATPEEVRLILIDPKRLEFSLYDGIPHLLCPVVKNPNKSSHILYDAINKMDDRYHALGRLKVRNIDQYNRRIKEIQENPNVKIDLEDEEREKLKPLPYIVIIIDELAELMMIGDKEVEYCIGRLAQLARAVGIHLVMATQRPSTDVITGTIKNNFSCRIAFRVPSKIDSQIIIDTGGAERLLGQGDMLFIPPKYPKIIRLHSSFVSLEEVSRLLKYIKDQRKPDYDEKITKTLKRPIGDKRVQSQKKDELFDKAVELILSTGQASSSYLQRKLRLGYARAARIIDQMEQEGIVGPSKGSKPREILISVESYIDKMRNKE
ncbi:MAG: DNA translocase FtsK 4TM domain-containing protein [Candidatus Aminicenantes bacterium]